MRAPHQKDWKIASITAHRDYGPKSKRRLEVAAETLAQNKSIDAIAMGGARGGDTDFLRAAFRARTGKRPSLIVVVPNELRHQPYEAVEAIKRCADEIIELGNLITKDDGFQAFRTRNTYLVELSSFLVACWDGNYKSGTGHAVKEAERLKRKIYRIPMSMD